MSSDTTSTPESAQAAYESLLDDPFWDFGLSSEQIEAEETRQAEEMKAAEYTLEEKFASMGLRFTKGFHGAMPVQAYGWILGQRFYFRFRHDTAVLHVGHVDTIKAQEDFEKNVERLARGRYSFMNPEAGKFTDLPESEKAPLRAAAIETHNLVVETELTIAVHPNQVTQSVSLEDFTGDKLSGFLTAEQAKEVFSFLVSKLKS